MQRVLQRVEDPAGPRAPGRAQAEAAWDRALPARWPSLVATAQAAGGELAAALMRVLEIRREQWCRRWRRPWPL
jgi:hypothetical protein